MKLQRATASKKQMKANEMHQRLCANGVGESATVGAPAAIVNGVVDAMWHLGVRHIDIPITPAKVWKLLREHGVTE